MKKFFTKHANKIAIVAAAYGLYLTCDWQWTNIKSFISGAVFFWYFKQVMKDGVGR